MQLSKMTTGCEGEFRHRLAALECAVVDFKEINSFNSETRRSGDIIPLFFQSISPLFRGLIFILI
jgi:hypothetical protein